MYRLEDFVLERPFPFLPGSFRTVAICLVSIDLAFILLHGVGFVLHRVGLTGQLPTMFWISQDGALPEVFNYLKWALIVAALSWLAFRDRWLTPFAWALVFLLILLDDSLQIHETLGVPIASYLGLADGFMIRPSDLGELLVFGAMGLSVVLLTGLSFLRGSPRSRRMSMTYAAIIMLLAFFGVGMDVLHQAVAQLAEANSSVDILRRLFGMVEDGGEMIVASLATAVTLAPPLRLASLDT